MRVTSNRPLHITRATPSFRSPTFYLVYQGENDRPLLEALRRAYACAHPALVTDEIPHRNAVTHGPVAAGAGQTLGGRLGAVPAAAHVHLSAHLAATLATTGAHPPPLPPSTGPLPPSHGRKIRVGFVSAHIRRHSICKLFCGLFLSLDRAIFDVVVFAALHESDHDNVTRTVLHHRNGAGNTDVEAVVLGMTMVKNRVEVVRRNIDVLVYLDVGMQPATAAWSAARLAPVQVRPNPSLYLPITPHTSLSPLPMSRLAPVQVRWRCVASAPAPA